MRASSVLHRLAGHLVEGAERLVHEQQARTPPRTRAIATRCCIPPRAGRELVREVGQPDEVEQLVGAGLPGGAPRAPGPPALCNCRGSSMFSRTVRQLHHPPELNAYSAAKDTAHVKYAYDTVNAHGLEARYTVLETTAIDVKAARQRQRGQGPPSSGLPDGFLNLGVDYPGRSRPQLPRLYALKNARRPPAPRAPAPRWSRARAA